MIPVVCICKNQVRLPDTALGKMGKCPFCGRPLQLVAPGYRPDGGRLECRLMVEEGPLHLGEQYILGGPGPVGIGKMPGKHIILSGQKISRHHCQLLPTPAGWRLEDQGSKNGTYVNGICITTCDLQNGDAIKLGEYLLRYTTGTGGPGTPGPLAAGRNAPPPPKSPLDSTWPPADFRSPPQPPTNDIDDDEPIVGLLEEDLVESQEDDEEDEEDEDLYGLADSKSARQRVAPSPIASPKAPPPEEPPPTCPACRKTFSRDVRICVECGVDLRTGRALLISQEFTIDAVREKAQNFIRVFSWVMPISPMPVPIASEAFGTRKPYVLWGIAALTVLISAVFWAYTKSPRMQQMKNYMLWCGDAEPSAEEIEAFYFYTRYGDRDAFRSSVETRQHDALTRYKNPSMRRLEQAHANAVFAAHQALPVEKQCFGQYHSYQLITHAFLHGNLLHLAGNLVALLVIGSRVNAVIGNVLTLPVYLLLAIAGGIGGLIDGAADIPRATLGASGVLAGLEGMYLVLMPLHKMYLAVWLRFWKKIRPWNRPEGIRYVTKIFAVRGFWVVLFFLSFDVVYTLLRVEDGVAHGVHLGGFTAGVVIGLILLLSRVVNCRGGDLLSGILGRRAWALVGRPSPQRKRLLERIP